MESINFCYWLQGYFEVLAAGDDPEAELTPEQVACIKDHLAMVFTKVTPDRAKSTKVSKAVASSKVVGITLGALANKMNVKATELLMRLLGMGMTGVHINTILDAETVKALADHFGSSEVTVSTESFAPFIDPTLICSPLEQKPIEWVAPPVNPNQVRLDIDAEIKKSVQRTTRPETYRTSCRWVGGGFGQKYC